MNITTSYLILNNKESYKCTNICVAINLHASAKPFVQVKLTWKIISDCLKVLMYNKIGLNKENHKILRSCHPNKMNSSNEYLCFKFDEL